MKVTKRDSVAMNVLRAMGYSKDTVAKMFNVSEYTVRYNTNDTFKRKKQDYQRTYERLH